MKINKKNWKVTVLNNEKGKRVVSVCSLKPTIDSETGIDYTRWPSEKWFKNNFKQFGNVTFSDAGDNPDYLEAIYAEK